jgi:Leucine-rich repeat (LRR) protein
MLLLLVEVPHATGDDGGANIRDEARGDTAPDDPNAVAAMRLDSSFSFHLNRNGNVDDLTCVGVAGWPPLGIRSRRHPEEFERLKSIHAEALKQIKGLHSIRTLRFSCVSDDETALVKDLTTLRDLDLGGTSEKPLGDAALVSVRGLTGLGGVHLRNAGRVTDAGLDNLGSLTNLSILDLPGTRVSGAGFKRLAGLKKIAWLDLSHTQLSDENIGAILPFSKLSRLRLDDTLLTDKSLPILAQLPPNANVSVNGTRITRRGTYSTPGARAIVHAVKFADDLAPELYGESKGLIRSRSAESRPAAAAHWGWWSMPARLTIGSVPR